MNRVISVRQREHRTDALDVHNCGSVDANEFGWIKFIVNNGERLSEQMFPDLRGF